MSFVVFSCGMVGYVVKDVEKCGATESRDSGGTYNIRHNPS